MAVSTQLLANAALLSYPEDGGASPTLGDGFIHHKEIRDDSVGLHAQIWKRENPDGSMEYIVAFTGTEKNAQDLWVDANYGWPQYESLLNDPFSRWQDLLTEMRSSPDNVIHFTGHSLGGALAQFAAYDYLDPEKQNSNVAQVDLTTFNALGGKAGIIAGYDSYDSLRAASLDARHFVIEQDGISKLGNDPVGGEVLSINVGELGVFPAHKMTNFIGVLEVDYLYATNRDEYIEVDSAQAVASILGAIGSEEGFDDLEAGARIIAGLVPALTGKIHGVRGAIPGTGAGADRTTARPAVGTGKIQPIAGSRTGSGIPD